MADVARIPRRRGGLCGLALIVLGAWGGLIPFVGPYFKFAFTPDKAWAYTSGRLYLSILPGAAALLGGLLVLATRSRAAGMLGGFLAAAGGAWFIVGAGVIGTVLHHASISPGLPVVHLGSGVGPSTTWAFLEQIGFFGGTGILIIFFGAMAMGRFSLLSAKDAADADADYDEFPSSGDPVTPTTTTGQYPAASQFPASPRPFPGDEPTGQFPATTGQYPPSTGQFPTTSTGQFPRTSTGPFPSSPSGQYPDGKS